MLFSGTFGFENLATLALAVNLVTYFMMLLHFDVAEAANHLTNFMGTSYILSVLMAILADTFIGRFKTTVIAGVLEFLVYIYNSIPLTSNKSITTKKKKKKKL